MNFSNSDKGSDAAKRVRDEASQASIANGGLPLNAVDRLSEQAKRAKQGAPFFTSDLSPSELLLTHQCGFEPLGQVMGSCVYQVGWQYVPQSTWGYASGEMEVMTASQINARNLAFSRLRQEAKLLGADGVVGVRFKHGESNFGTSTVEFIAVGTAVKRRGAPPLPAGVEPFLSNLSGQDHWLLRQKGLAPVAFVFGTCAWYQYPDWLSAYAMTSWSNAELTSLSSGLNTAREIAMRRLTEEASSFHAVGVVGVSVASHVEVMAQQTNTTARTPNGVQGGFIMHYTAWGTAIGPDPSPASPSSTVSAIVSLLDPT